MDESKYSKGFSNISIISSFDKKNSTIETESFRAEIFLCRVVHNMDQRAIRRFRNYNSYENHYSYSFHLQIILSGWSECYCDGKILRLEAGQFSIDAPGSNIKIIEESDQFSKFTVEFNLESKNNTRFAESYIKAGKDVMKFNANYIIDDLLKHMTIVSVEEPAYCAESVSAYLTAFFYEIYRIINPEKKSEVNIIMDARLQKVIDYIDENINSIISLDELEAVAFVSKQHLTRLFNREFGLSPQKYISAKRVERIKLYLLRSEMSLSEIAERVGYSSEHSLVRFFKKSTGRSPMKYKREIETDGKNRKENI